jgi:hypothetical protein
MSSNITRQPYERPETQPARRRGDDGWRVARFALWAVGLVLLLTVPALLGYPGGRPGETDWPAVALFAAVLVPALCFALWRLFAAFADLTAPGPE